MSQSADVVIVGGGGVGSAIAYFLTALLPRLKVVVAEPDPTYAHASTALAAGGLRQMFSTPENVQMSQFGLQFIQSAEELLAVDGEAPSLGFKSENYMRLCSEAAREVVADQTAMQTRLGAAPTVLEREELQHRFPWMNVKDVGFAVIGGGGEGIFDPYGLLQALRRKSIAQGATYRAARAVAIHRDGMPQVSAVELSDGELLSCGVVVNAAGPQAGAVADMAHLDLPVRALKGHTFAFRPQTGFAGCPIILDHVSGMNLKSEGDLFLTTLPQDVEAESPDDFEIDHAFFEAEVWPTLAHRVPQFEVLKLMRAWVGHIEWNRFDGNPVLGRHPVCDNFIFANGFSGHGAQHIPATGRAIAELLAFGEYRTLDLSRFGYERLLEGAPIAELI